MRGFGVLGRRKQLREWKHKFKIEVICLQETIKADFSPGELASISEGENFEWVWTVAQGHSGGTPMGAKTDNIAVISSDRGEFYSSMKIFSRQDKTEWEVVNVFGPVQTERKADFLAELGQKITSMGEYFIIGGDFNLIRFAWEKSSDNVNQVWMDAFNEFIRDNGLKELIRKGSKYTWTNKQDNPVMSTLDRVLMSVRWDMIFKRASCESLTRVGSDHCPILVNSDDHRFQKQHCFRFESAWLLQQGFREAVVACWPERGGKTVQDYWRDMKVATRKFCKGWGPM
jgi:exonuclease III